MARKHYICSPNDHIFMFLVKKEPQKQETKETKAYDKLQEVRKQIREANEKLGVVRKEAFKDIALGNLKAECKEEISEKALWQALISVGCTCDLEDMTDLWIEINGLDGADTPQERNRIIKSHS